MTALEEVELALRKGFTAKPDIRRGDIWCSFRKDNLVVWYLSNTKWATSFIENNMHTEHKYYSSLEEALNRID